MKNQKLHVLAYNWQPENKSEIEFPLADFCHITHEDDQSTFQLKLGMEHYDAIILGANVNDDTPFSMLAAIRQSQPATPVIVIGPDEEPQLLARAMQEGASDFITMPCQSERIRYSLEKAATSCSHTNELNYLRSTQNVVYSFDSVVAETTSFKQIVEHLRRFSAFDSTMLFTGEFGTGKSFLAGTVHFNSARKDRPFMKINCANMDERILASELFGHEAHAFPEADKTRVGRIEQCDGGTIFLNEVSALSFDLQAKLLRLLEEKSFERLGGTRTFFVDVRVMASTSKDLSAKVADGTFREDLYYRLNVLPVNLPPLRDRADCIVPLAHRLLMKKAAAIGKAITGFSESAVKLLAKYNWPGNILQLANVIERAVILENGPLITPLSLKNPGERRAFESKKEEKVEENCLVTDLANNEYNLIVHALRECNWVQKRAALKLGVSPRSLNYKIKKFKITCPRWRKNKGRIRQLRASLANDD